MSDPKSISRQASDEAISQILPTIGGAGNALLFGAPEYLVKLATQAMSKMPKEQVDKVVNEWKAKNAGYGTGEVLGTVGSMFIPGGAVARGAGAIAKGVGAAKAGGAFEKLANYLGGSGGTIGEQARRGLAIGAEQAVPRAVVEGADTGDWKKAVDDALIGTAGGGLVGVGAKGLGTAIEKIGKTGIGKSINKGLETLPKDAILSGVDATPGALDRFMKQSAARLGVNKQGYRYNNVEDFKNDAVAFLTGKNREGKNLTNGENLNEYLDRQGPEWQKAVDKYNEKPVDFNNPKVLKDVLTDPGVMMHVDRAGFDKASFLKQVRDVKSDLDKYRDYNDAKSYLQMLAAEGRATPGDMYAKAKTELAESMMSKIDEHFEDAVSTIKGLREEYPFVKFFKDVRGKSEADISSPFQQGSQTQMNIAAQDIMTGKNAQNAIPGFLGSMAGPFISSVTRDIGTGVSGAIGSGIYKAGKPDGLLSKLPAYATNVAEQAPATAVELGNTVANAPQPTNLPAMSMDTPEAKQAGVDRLKQGIDAIWDSIPERVALERQRPGYEQEFKNELSTRLLKPDGSVDYLRASKVLFPNNEAAEQEFRDAYKTYVAVSRGLPAILNPLGTGSIPGMSKSEAEVNKIGAKAALVDVLVTGGKIDRPKAEEIINGIVDNPLEINPATKYDKIKQLLQSYSQTGFDPESGRLAQAGILF